MRVTVVGKLVSAEIKGENGTVYGALLQGEYVRQFYAKGEGAAEVLAQKAAQNGDLPDVALTGSVFADSPYNPDRTAPKEYNGKLTLAVTGCALASV